MNLGRVLIDVLVLRIHHDICFPVPTPDGIGSRTGAGLLQYMYSVRIVWECGARGGWQTNRSPNMNWSFFTSATRCVGVMVSLPFLLLFVFVGVGVAHDSVTDPDCFHYAACCYPRSCDCYITFMVLLLGWNATCCAFFRSSFYLSGPLRTTGLR